MKRWIALLLAICISLPLVGCGSDEETTDEAALATEQPPIEALVTPAPTPIATETPMTGEEAQQILTGNIGGGEGTLEEQKAPSTVTFETDAPELPWETEDGAQDGQDGEAQPTQAPVIDDDPYTYSSLTNQTLKVKFLYPEGWTSDPTTDTITMVEPILEGDVPARFSVTSFEYEYKERDISTGRLKTHLTDYLKTLVTGYNEYQLGDSGYDIAFADSTAIYATYLAIKGNSFIQGIAIVGYGKNGRVYCMHFCCEQDDYIGFTDLITKLADQVTPINK